MMTLKFVWTESNLHVDSHNVYLGTAHVGYVTRLAGKTRRYMSEVYTPIDSHRAVLYYSGSDLERAKRLTEERITEFFVAAGLMPAPQDETKNDTHIHVWVKLFRLMEQHPDDKIITWYDDDPPPEGGEAELYNVNYDEKRNTIELIFD